VNETKPPEVKQVKPDKATKRPVKPPPPVEVKPVEPKAPPRKVIVPGAKPTKLEDDDEPQVIAPPPSTELKRPKP
jgi:hypothetical protein